jgi:hypothetical protein
MALRRVIMTLQSLSLSSEFEKHGVSLGDGVAKSDLFATAPGIVIAREVCGFLATLAAAYPGSAAH